MAIVAIARNGIGLGHISRMVALCNALARTGLRPYLFAEGTAARAISHVVPTVCIGEPGRHHSYSLRELELRLNSTALLSQPACVIEDTYPFGLTLDPCVRRFLLVRPLAFAAMEALAHDAMYTYERVFVADQPDSPTWPYDAGQTKALTGWTNWTCVGPLYRSPTQSEIRDAQRRYGWSPHSRLCVFSLGGGGEHAGADDASAFLARAETIAQRILSVDPGAQMIMVRGPLMSGNRKIPASFRVIDTESSMPALFAAADLACIRPGFNSTWECIAGSTPIVPIPGTSHQEPIEDRLARLRQFGFLATDVEEAWRRGTTVKRDSAVSRNLPWTGGDVASIRRALLAQREVYVPIATPMPPAGRKVGADPAQRIPPFHRRLRESMQGKPVFIRVDDVTSLDATLKSLIGVLRHHNTHASLQVIPYLCDFDASSLQAASYSPTDISIGQHGYCHVSPLWLEKVEFSPREPMQSELHDLVTAKQSLEQRFGEYFDRGMSPPFDAMPLWLGEAWEQMGGRYISVIRNLPQSGRIPFVNTSIDVWDWRTSRRSSWPKIGRDLMRSCARLGYAGIVLHPQHFRTASDRHWLERLLGELQRSGAEMTPMSSLVQFQSVRALSTSSRRYAALQ